VILLALSLVTLAHADSSLVGEIRNLRNSLPVSDVTRPALTLRLADTLCNEALKSRIASESKGEATSRDLRRMEEEALGLYETSLKGEEGAKKKPAGEDAYKITFQRARLMQELGQTNSALVLYREIGAGSEMTSLKRESFLRVAEIQEHAAPGSAEVETAYRKTLEYCQGTDTCAYAHYRLAWVYRNKGDASLAPAIAEVKLALFDSKGGLREEALRDWIAFVSVNGGDGSAALAEFDEFARKQGKTELLDQLAAAYFLGGNRVAGIKILTFVHGRNPKLMSALKLLEESHGQRDWAAVDSLTNQASTTLLSQSASWTDAERGDAEKILKRVSVQLDQDKSQDAKIKTAFQEVIDLDLALFPKSVDHAKMMEGWLASESDYAVKAKKTDGWIANPALALTVAEQTRFREMLLFSAQMAKAYPDVVIQATALETLAASAGNTAKAREYRYLSAHAHYDAKENAAALPMFQELAKVTSVKEADSFAVKSQHLALDILNQEKRYGELTTQAQAWTANNSLISDSKLAPEVAEMAKASEQAEFQTFSAKGATPEALRFFLVACQANKYRPQSCENAKVLSVQLKDQASLIATLRVVGTPEELASELEAAGYYAESAKIREKAAGDLKANLRVALFYELAGDDAARERVLASILKSPMVRKPFPESEDALLVMIRESKLFEPGILNLAWSGKVKAEIADAFEVLGRSTPTSRKILASSTENTGEGWARITLADFKTGFDKQHAINFYGRDGKRKLSARLDLLKKLSATTEKVLNQADLRLRFVLLDGLKRAYTELAAAITASPIPAGLDAEQVKVVQSSLAELSAPFTERAKNYESLFSTELAKAKEPADTEYANVITVSTTPVFEYAVAKKNVAAADAVAPTESVKDALARLSKAPDDTGTLSTLENLYSSAGKTRLASYYRGRLLALQKEGNKP
jgi:hypothetical protein